MIKAKATEEGTTPEGQVHSVLEPPLLGHQPGVHANTPASHINYCLSPLVKVTPGMYSLFLGNFIPSLFPHCIILNSSFLVSLCSALVPPQIHSPYSWSLVILIDTVVLRRLPAGEQVLLRKAHNCDY